LNTDFNTYTGFNTFFVLASFLFSYFKNELSKKKRESTAQSGLSFHTADTWWRKHVVTAEENRTDAKVFGWWARLIGASVAATCERDRGTT
jgi:hypothetical protein